MKGIKTGDSKPDTTSNKDLNDDGFSFLDERRGEMELTRTQTDATAADKAARLARSYDRAAWIYELGAQAFSAGRIKSSKRSQLKHINPGDKIVYLGTGGGEDALMAAREGARVTCIDISQGMLDQVERKLAKENLQAELICQSAFDHDRFDEYDICAANYFLNVFKRDDMIRMMRHAAKFVRPGGKFLIADVALPQGNILSRTFNVAYLKAAMLGAWAGGLVPLHENYDYASYFDQCGLEFGDVEYFRYLSKGPVLFQSMMATKAG